MKLPKLYRKVYLIAKEECDEDDQFNVSIYVQAKLTLDEDNNKFWQLVNNESNLWGYELSDLDIYDLSVDWSRNEDPEQTSWKNRIKHNPEHSYNRATVEQGKLLDEIPF